MELDQAVIQHDAAAGERERSQDFAHVVDVKGLGSDHGHHPEGCCQEEAVVRPVGAEQPDVGVHPGEG